MIMRRTWAGSLLMMGAVLVSAPAVATSAPSTGAGAEPTTQAVAAPPESTGVFIVQALPDSVVSVSIDGTLEAARFSPGGILGPLSLPPGEHLVTVSGRNPAWTMEASVRTTARGSSDVVLHRPAAVEGRPTVTVYRNPIDAVPRGKGRVVVAHTATVPPADITVDGDVVFDNIANGEFATEEVPAGDHQVSIVPTGRTAPVLLGPVQLVVQPQTLTQVYAVGQPTGGSMDLVVHTLSLQARGSAAPSRVETGSAGLVSALTPRTSQGRAVQPVQPYDPWLALSW